MYADDGIFYSDKAFSHTDVIGHFAKLGLEIALNKSG
jgi:hypothetical protein